MLRFVSAVLALTLAAGSSVAADKPVSFIGEVAPVLKDHCFACHNPKKAAGRYDMTTFAKLLGGGSGGPAITPNKSADSEFHGLLVTDEDRRMPPRDKGEPVPPAAATLVARWIDQGAKPDAGLDVTADLTRELRKRWQPPAPPARYPAPVPVRAVAFTPDNKSLVVSGYHELLVYDAATLALTKRVRTRAERAHAFAFLADGTLAVAGGRPGLEGDVRVYDLSAGGATADGVTDPKVRVATLLEADDEVLALAVTADGKRLAAGGTDRVVRVWDVARGVTRAELRHSVENHADWVLGLAFTPDGGRLLSASRDRTAKVWDLSRNESVAAFGEHRDTVTGVAPSADGRFGYSVGADRLLRKWELTGDGKQVSSLAGHADRVLRVVPHHPTKRLVTGSADKSVRVWDAGTGKNTHTLTGPADHVLAVAVSGDGNTVAAGSAAGELWLWPLGPGKGRRLVVAPGRRTGAS